MTSEEETEQVEAEAEYEDPDAFDKSEEQQENEREQIMKSISTFAGVDMAAVDAAMSQSKVEEKIEEIEEIPDPTMKIKSIDSSGEILIEFNQEMIVPNIKGQSWYAYMFAFSIKSSLDDSIIYASFNRKVV